MAQLLGTGGDLDPSEQTCLERSTAADSRLLQPKTTFDTAFLITDGELVVLRVMGHAHGSGLRGDPATAPAAGRSSLPAYIYIHKHEHLTALCKHAGCLDGLWVFLQHPQVWLRTDTSSWQNRGKGGLTVQSGLFYLAWLAAIGMSMLQPSYPGFDSCWPLGNLEHPNTRQAKEGRQGGSKRQGIRKS